MNIKLTKKMYGIKKIYGNIGWGEFGTLKLDFQDFSNSIYDRWKLGKKPKLKDVKKLLQTCHKFIEINKHLKKQRSK